MISAGVRAPVSYDRGLAPGSGPYYKEAASRSDFPRKSHRTKGCRTLGTTQVKAADLRAHSPQAGAVEQRPGLEGKADVNVPLVTAGAWPFRILMFVWCEPHQTLEYALCLSIQSFININQHLFGTRDDSGRWGSGCGTLQSLLRDAE